MKNNIRPSNEKIIEVLKKKKGRLTVAATALNISVSSIYNYVRDDEELQKALKLIKEDELDFAEDQLHLLMRGIPVVDEQGKLIDWKVRPDNASVMFYLKTQGRDRGYVEKVDGSLNLVFPEIPQISISFRDAD